jgi:hypothetical protein
MDARSTQVPADLRDLQVLKRFLIQAAEKLDLIGENYTTEEWVGEHFTNNPLQNAIIPLNKVGLDPDLQDVSDKVDELIGALQGANILQ